MGLLSLDHKDVLRHGEIYYEDLLNRCACRCGPFFSGRQCQNFDFEQFNKFILTGTEYYQVISQRKNGFGSGAIIKDVYVQNFLIIVLLTVCFLLVVTSVCFYRNWQGLKARIREERFQSGERELSLTKMRIYRVLHDGLDRLKIWLCHSKPS